MAELKIPVQIDGFKCVEEMAQAVLNYTYKGKMLQEWADSISKPKTNADRIRNMNDEEFSHFLFGIQCAPASKPKEWLDWLSQKAEEGE